MKNIRKISADYIFPISDKPVKNGVLVIDNSGLILETGNREEYGVEELEIYEGILCPGFVNTHCHLELSVLRNKIPSGNGLPEFLKQLVIQQKLLWKRDKLKAIIKAENEMIENGIVAVGDISNNTLSFKQKKKGNLLYHTFVEVFDLGPSTTKRAIRKGKKVYSKAPDGNGFSKSITPHTPYTVTPELFKLTDEFTADDGKILSIHMQESKDENTLFIDGTGLWAKNFREWGIDYSWFKHTGKSSLQSCSEYLTKGNRILFVHNTFTNREDIKWAQQYFSEVFWCTCPNANLYIENTLPDYQMFLDENAKCTIGTDSLASNSRLSVLGELQVISSHNPQISLHTLLTWATLNGAVSLGFDKKIGSFAKHKQPGVNLIKNIDLESLQLKPESKIQKLI